MLPSALYRLATIQSNVHVQQHIYTVIDVGHIETTLQEGEWLRYVIPQEDTL